MRLLLAGSPALKIKIGQRTRSANRPSALAGTVGPALLGRRMRRATVASKALAATTDKSLSSVTLTKKTVGCGGWMHWDASDD
jgi:hypothetical protein